MQGWIVVLIALAYVSLLFAVASHGDRQAARGRVKTSRPFIYALSLAIYCTSWTFFGSVGLAAEHGIEYVIIFIGPILVFLFGYPVLVRIVRLAKAEKITSVADFLAARYGKSFAVASIAAVIATIGTVPYIALQLKAISGSLQLMTEHYNAAVSALPAATGDVSLMIALLLALFSVLFGTRHADATEHQDGLILAVAVESVVKLAAFLAVGLFILFAFDDRSTTLMSIIAQNSQARAAVGYQPSLATWVVLTVISGLVILLLPRQFYVTVVENRSESELKTAGWLFPLYLVLINAFVLPIAIIGLHVIGNQTNADFYMLALPLLADHDVFAMIAFIGGLSAATAMVIVATVALSIMISNDLIIPLFLKRFAKPERDEAEDWSKTILNIRRASILLVLLAAYLYFRETQNNMRLASIGLLSFAAIAQFGPAFIGALVWRGANARGAIFGMSAGIAVWAYTLLLPTMAPSWGAIVSDGLFGIAALRPQALFGVSAEPLNHGVMWSLGVNTVCFVLGSLSRIATPLERIQAAIFVPRDPGPIPIHRRFRTAVTIDDLKDAIARYLGVERTERSFHAFAQEEGRELAGNEPADTRVIRFSEQLLTSAVGSSSARLILSLLFKRRDTDSKGAIRLLDDASEALQHNRDLLQIALDQMEQGITVFDADLRLTCWNKRFRKLFDLPDNMGTVGLPMTAIIHFLNKRGDLTENAQGEALDRMTTFGRSWQVTLQTSGRIVDIRSNPMPDGGMVTTYTDVTARVRADLALKQANETLEQRVASRTAELTRVNEELAQAQEIAEEANLGKTRFLAAAGHDILQPLNAARLYCSSLIERTTESSEVGAAANIDSALESVETILGAVLDISRLDTGAMKPKASVFSLDGLLARIESDFAPVAAEKGLLLRVVPSSLVVNTDRNLLRRLLQNLVSNAIKYTKAGTVLVGVRRRGGLAEIQVIDTGIGIRDDQLNTVFREFERLDEGMRAAEGLGLGLSIVDRIARVLRLELRLRSKPGKGTRFGVVIDVSDASATQLTSVAPATSAIGHSLSGLSVLCIDNDRRIVDGMRELLRGWGCTVACASGSSEVTDMLDDRRYRPDVVLADYHLDNENGLEVIELLRRRLGQDLACCLVTADRSADVREAAEALAVAIFNKPVRPAALRLYLSNHKVTATAAE
ncbi:MAG: PAS domain-containing hybrid sensor histidine kinase/response regulator [Rhizobiaceae bacterium]